MNFERDTKTDKRNGSDFGEITSVLLLKNICRGIITCYPTVVEYAGT